MMKKVLFFLFLVCVAFNIRSQVSVKLGLKGGLNISNVDASGFAEGINFENKALTSGHFGVFARFKLLGTLAIQPEILYSMQGFTLECSASEIGFSQDFKLKMNYIQVPIMLKFYPVSGFNLQAGPQIGYLASAKFMGEDFKEELQSTHWALNVGAGYDFPFGVGLDARYCIGLTNVIEDFRDGNGSNKSNVFTISVSYCF